MIEKTGGGSGERSEPKLSKEGVTEMLRNNPADLSPVHSYLDEKGKEGKTSKETLDLNVEEAEIYRDAGLMDRAREAYTAAAEQAFQEREDELYKKIMDELDKLS